MSIHQQSGTTTVFLSAAEFWNLPEIEGKRLELVEGRVVEMPPAGPRHNEIAFYIATLIYEHVRRHQLGWASGDGTGYVISGEHESVLIPDASFVSAERLPADGTPDTGWPFPPDLAVEVVSPSDRADDVNSKVTTYLRAGTTLVWVVWPRTGTIYSFRANGADTLGFDDRLEGGDVLPGFSVQVSEIFEGSMQRRDIPEREQE